jgi:DNA-binding PadR family transcriptional regulator
MLTMVSTMNLINTREALLLATLSNGEKYGRAVRDEYESRARQKLPLGSLYTTLARMEEKGLIRSRSEESSAGRGGNRRTYYRITAPGQKALAAYVERSGAISDLVISHA